ncbi:histidine ammonia-lyase [Legionella dresdenensis]|uniref:Histidine ammonia-lyase n=1 Tax=Legionella dresdenensis TaxID=450200 RepID=A0ABV8CC09_9GAMM
MTNRFTLNPGQLKIADLARLTAENTPIQLAEEALARIDSANACVRQVLENDKIVYGINTGFGSLANQIISANNLKQLQRNLILSHACGTGDLLDNGTARLLLLLKINSLAQGYSGVSLKLLNYLITFNNRSIIPCIPAKGSVGASGDLAPLAHMSLPLLGVGEVCHNGKIISAEEGLAIAGLPVLELEPKEGLALINGLQASAAIAIQAYLNAEKLFNTAIIAGALSVDAANGSDVPFDARIHQAKGYRHQSEVAAWYRDLLAGSAIRESHRHCERVQDPYSLRCQPQIMGAVLHQMEFVKETLEIEANSVSDNPLIFPEQGEILSGGNFHGEMLAMASDNLALAIAEIGAAAERRIALLIDKNFSGLPAYLVKEGGLNSGFMIAHVTAAACASDNKALAHPHSVDSLPTSANQEDHVSMATNAARRLHAMIDNTATILAIELLAACQGLEFRKPLQTSSALQKYYAEIRQNVPAYDQDRYFAPDIAVIKNKILQGDFKLDNVYNNAI